MDALLAAIPVDLEADARVSDGARALFVASFVALQFFVGLAYYPPGAAHPRERWTGGQFALWMLGSAVVLAIAIAVLRRRLLANRISRQILASLGVIYYASALGEYAGMRLGANDAFIDAAAFLWSGAILVVLGITLRPVFAAFGAIPLVALGVLVAHPEHAGILDRLVPSLVAIATVLVWGLGPRYSAWREGRRP